MKMLTVCFSTHRLETLPFTADLMASHDQIILEEPFHPDFQQVLAGAIELEEHLLELDTDYPTFTLSQYRLLQEYHLAGKQIVQAEPYLDHLLDIHYFLADGHKPDELTTNPVKYRVYRAERAATGMLLAYYQAVTGEDFKEILSTMNNFARADAARFILRDSLRVKRIVELLADTSTTYVEAGSIHLLLYTLLRKTISDGYRIRLHSIDRQTARRSGHTGSLFSPGDELTLHYIFGRSVRREKWRQLCARALIYAKIVQIEEELTGNGSFPHTENEIASIAAVRHLSMETCEFLFRQIRLLSAQDAAAVVADQARRSKRAENR